MNYKQIHRGDAEYAEFLKLTPRTPCLPWHRSPPFVPRVAAARRCDTCPEPQAVSPRRAIGPNGVLRTAGQVHGEINYR